MSSMQYTKDGLDKVEQCLSWTCVYRKDVVISGGLQNNRIKKMVKEYLPHSCIGTSEDPSSGDLVCSSTNMRDFLGIEVVDLFISFYTLDVSKNFEALIYTIKDSIKIGGFVIVASSMLSHTHLELIFSDFKSIKIAGGFIFAQKICRYDNKKQVFPL